MAGNWTKITVNGKVGDLESICAVMSMLDNGLMIEDYSDFELNGMYGELVDDQILNADKEAVKVSLFGPEEKNPLEYRIYLEQRLPALGIPHTITTEGMNEDDWSESWKQYYHPIPLGKVTIVPAWQEYNAKEGEIIIKMDPGMAFGTGTHETTRLVMRIMQDVVSGGERVLDVGTGSGILSICASKLGAKECLAYDIDPIAVKVARENALRDGCENVSVAVSDLLKDVDRSGGKFEVCVANIVSDIIIRMMPDIGDFLDTGAKLILSGIICDRADEVRASVLEHGFTILREEKENDWVAILATR